MRFYLDEDLSYRAAEIARSLGVDVTTTRDYGRNGASDEEQLALAAAEGRCLVTRNDGHFRRVTTEFLVSGRPHFGVLLVPRSIQNNDIGSLVSALLAHAVARPEDMPAYMVDYLRPAPR